MAADRIQAHPTTVTGSIGVIFTSLSFAGLMEKLGVEDQTITGGEFKDAGSPFRRLTRTERAAYSLGTSLAIAAWGGLVLQWSSLGLRRGPWAALLGGVTLVAAGAALASRRTRSSTRAAPPPRFTPAQILQLLLAAVVVAVAPSGWGKRHPRQRQRL